MKHWPTLSDEQLSAARAAIERATRAVLARESGVVLAGGTADAYAMGIGAHTSGMGAQLARWLESGVLSADAAIRDALEPHLAHGRKRATRLQHELLPALDALLEIGTVPVVIKGMHVALAYCDEPGVRPMSDVDVVVPREKARVAELALARAGFELVTRARHAPKRSEWIRHDVDRAVFSFDRPDVRSKWTLELHESFDRDFKGVFFARLDALRDHVAPFQISGRAVLAPTHPLLLLTLACQLSSELDAMRLRRLVDLIQVIRNDRERSALDWDAVLHAMRKLRLARFTFPAFELAERLAPGTVDSSALEAARADASGALRRVVATLTPAGEVPMRRGVVRALMWADSPAQVISGAVGVAMRKLRF